MVVTPATMVGGGAAAAVDAASVRTADMTAVGSPELVAVVSDALIADAFTAKLDGGGFTCMELEFKVFLSCSPSLNNLESDVRKLLSDPLLGQGCCCHVQAVLLGSSCEDVQPNVHCTNVQCTNAVTAWVGGGGPPAP